MIRDYIVKHISKKLGSTGSLVIYDQDQFYAELLPSLSQIATVVDIRESILSARENAYAFFRNELVKEHGKRLIVYSPFNAPLDEQSKVEDPFYIFTLGNSYFPNDSSDNYETLCKSCYPLKEQEINELFSQSTPDFETIDALGDGNTYAKLQVLTGGKSEKEILQGLMLPSEEYLKKLTSDKSWFSEYKKLLQLLGVKTNAKTYDQVRDELWRVMLFSEFAFDLPVELPKKLQSIPVIKSTGRVLVMDLVKGIRNNKAAEQTYIEKAIEIEDQLSLAMEFKKVSRLGSLVTFAFEDSTYFNLFVELLIKKEISDAEEIIRNNKENIWPQHDEERKRIWLLASLAWRLLSTTSQNIKYPKIDKEIVRLYSNTIFEVDLLYREFETTFSQIISGPDSLDTLTKFIRQSYREFIDQLQKAFQETIRHWPLEGIDSNIKLFDKYIAPELKGKKKTAYILVDALRFEIGKDLEQTLSKHFTVKITPSCAFVPTVTKFAMAALLPNAEKALALNVVGGKLEAFLDGSPAPNLEARRNYLKTKLGDRCEIIELDDLLSNYSSTPDLLVVTTKEIDGAGENLNVTSALASIKQSLSNLVSGLVRIKKLGYEKIVIATDHGFMIYPSFQPGDNVKKPDGEWVLRKSRCVAGRGTTTDQTQTFSANDIGVKSTVEQFQFLKNYSVFEKNTQYFHEGISLQEAIVPIIEITPRKSNSQTNIEITLTYRGKSEGTVTTRRPIIDLMCFQEGNIGFDPVSIKIEAIADGVVVGEPYGAEEVNSLTKLVEVYPQRAHKIPISLADEFEGKLDIVASDPVSGKVYSTLILETNYLD